MRYLFRPIGARAPSAVRHDMFVDSRKENFSSSARSAMCVMEKKHVASTGLMRLEVALRYKHTAPNALKIAKRRNRWSQDKISAS